MKTPNIFHLLGMALLAVFVISSCQNESKDAASEETQRDIPAEIAEDVEVPLPSLPYVAVFNDETEQLTAEQNPDFDRSSLSLEVLTQILLDNYPEIGVETDRVSNDTLYVRITDAQHLTQQMGSSGAQMYLLEATYAFTELPDINAVHFDFEEGDHALPGTYTRSSFADTTPN